MTASTKEALESAEKALRFLADHDRPQGGQSRYNAEHLIDIADHAKAALASLSCGEARERIARMIRRAMIDNPTGGTSEERAAKRASIADEYATAYLADLATGCVPGEAEPEYVYDDPRFNKGVQHVVDLIARELGVTEWVAGDGSEDYDCDLWQTILNILAAKSLYDADEGKFAVVGTKPDEASIRAELAEARQEAADSLAVLDAIADYVGCPHDEELTVDHVRQHYMKLENAAQRQGIEDAGRIANAQAYAAAIRAGRGEG
ncbi:hypothetical protein [Afipia carboxidovorans]|uniref:hypothetical protein n=1 Tax=Afipia carboxidovorans TaxID=40137 RepID=UPI00308BEAE7|nr:hypothetical protein CRBSH125_08840 [Afipia carboxidovorans]